MTIEAQTGARMTPAELVARIQGAADDAARLRIAESLVGAVNAPTAIVETGAPEHDTTDDASLDMPTRLLLARRPLMNTDRHVVSPGHALEFRLGEHELDGLARKTGNVASRILGVVAKIDTVLEFSTAFTSEEPIQLVPGPSLYLISPRRMRHEDYETFIEEAARRISEDPDDKNEVDHYKKQISTPPFQLIVSDHRTLLNQEWDSPDAQYTFLKSDADDTPLTTFMFLEKNKAQPDMEPAIEFAYGFEPLPELRRIFPLASFTLAGSKVTIVPSVHMPFVENPLPLLSIDLPKATETESLRSTEGLEAAKFERLGIDAIRGLTRHAHNEEEGEAGAGTPAQEPTRATNGRASRRIVHRPISE